MFRICLSLSFFTLAHNGGIPAYCAYIRLPRNCFVIETKCFAKLGLVCG